MGIAAAVLAGWQLVAPGLEVGRFPSPRPAAVGDSVVTVVRVDPRHHELRLLSAKLLDLPRNPTAEEWVREHGVVAAINASMYQTDHRTSVAYLRDGPRVNNGRWSRDQAVFAAGPLDPSLPAVQILDRQCQDADALAARYRVLAQNIRMLDCQGRNTWARQERRWSTACVGTDGAGRVLLIHARSAWSTHDFIEVLRALPLDLKRLMYVEGGPEASLYLAVGGKVLVEEMGSFETGFREDDGNRRFWPLPNVIGVAPRP
jgi:phosphodiester glycosidase